MSEQGGAAGVPSQLEAGLLVAGQPEVAQPVAEQPGVAEPVAAQSVPSQPHKRPGAGKRTSALKRARSGATSASTVPTLRIEKRLLRERGVRLLAGMDEVGRGAFAGPVSVGVCVVDLDSPTAPAGLRDSKLLTATVRERLVPRLRRWSVSSAVGSASAAEIDAYGILPALRLAGERALAQLPELPDLVLLDGNYNWLKYRRVEAPTLFDGSDELVAPREWQEPPSVPGVDGAAIPVTTLIKADLRCAAVAAASVLAKVARDSEMIRFSEAESRYGWRENKGYASPEHLAALREHGPCELHRRSWRLRVLEGREDDSLVELGAAALAAVEDGAMGDRSLDDAEWSEEDGIDPDVVGPDRHVTREQEAVL